MRLIRLYLDEDSMDRVLVEALRARGSPIPAKTRVAQALAP